MPKQRIRTEYKRVAMAVNSKSDTLSPKKSSVVRVSPHVRVIQGKAVMIAGYSYTRKG